MIPACISLFLVKSIVHTKLELPVKIGQASGQFKVESLIFFNVTGMYGRMSLNIFFSIFFCTPLIESNSQDSQKPLYVASKLKRKELHTSLIFWRSLTWAWEMKNVGESLKKRGILSPLLMTLRLTLLRLSIISGP